MKRALFERRRFEQHGRKIDGTGEIQGVALNREVLVAHLAALVLVREHASMRQP